MPTRRELLGAGGLALAGLAGPWLAARLPGGRLLAPAAAAAAGREAVIRMRSDALGSRVWFDPVGLRVAPGTTVRWVLEANVHSATAYHPSNGFAPRIPSGAEPWDSGMLTEPGQSFAVRLDVPGVYDYYCIPHEMAGMVGRIVVAPEGAEIDAVREPVRGAGGLKPPSPAALAAFPPIDSILRSGAVRL
jgi:plastocyanin